ncbi:hypothetical protein M5K25_024796 [Dendrobium thyrsiflorum]|uniref:Uncharacterized protein n=1 Tax=Dendrobium thyrsiflorum TaxID=117978 RepID=A0ABD0U7Z3_DENTH
MGNTDNITGPCHQAMSPPISTPDGTPPPPPPVTQSSPVQPRWATALKHTIFELRLQRRIAAPLSIMNMTQLGADRPLRSHGTICGQAYGAGNRGLLRKTLLMEILLLLVASIPISFLWLNMDAILLRFGQQKEIASLAKKYVVFLLPDQLVTSFLSPLEAYLNSRVPRRDAPRSVQLSHIASSAFVTQHSDLQAQSTQGRGDGRLAYRPHRRYHACFIRFHN